MRVAFPAVLAMAIAFVPAVAACTEHFPTLPITATGGDGQAPSVVPPDRRKSASSSPVVFDPVRGGVWTANGDVGSISYVDVDTRALVQEIPISRTSCSAAGSPCDVRSVALSPDGAFVAAVDRAAASVTLVDADTREVRAIVAVGSHPRACVWDAADPRWLYVVLEDDGAVAIVDRLLAQVVANIPVGRLPSGATVSAARRELYVAHRIDGDLTIVDLPSRRVVADVPIADEPFSDPKVPNGKPFGFESMALTTDGQRAWLPHELLAPTHPFLFNETLFPAVSIVDVVDKVEAQTNPNEFPPATDGRKNLFGAINLIGQDGQPQIFSQPCAAALHPNAVVGWVLACGSEDVLVFDVNQGIATDAIRNLPVDHPVGLALDDTGQRLFVMGDQSHTLVTLDTANGALVHHTTLYGPPIPLLHEADPIDPMLRAGLTLFFRANSAKGALATTGNDWMSCGGCHLDGFSSTNARFFEALTPGDPAKDAAIGHVGLRESLSSATPAGSNGTPFDPHDVLVALLDQGGLAPDRTGNDRTLQVDPNCSAASVPSAACPTEARTMAAQLARVVSRDLPAQPSWQKAAGVPNAAWDTQYCGGCHETEYRAWQSSVHAYAAADSMVRSCLSHEDALAVSRGRPSSGLAPFCAGCHDPVNLRLGKELSLSPRGVSCLGCHDVDREIRAGGNGDLQASAHVDWAQDHKTRALASLDRLRQPEFCGGCHQQFVPGTGLRSIATLDEYHASSSAGTTLCVDCHMHKTNGVADHRFPGGNVYLAQIIGDATLVQEQLQNLSGVVQLDAKRVAAGVQVTVTNRGAAHSFPTGVADIREPWVEVQQVASSGDDKAIVHFGGPIDGLVPLDAARLGSDIGGEDGGILYEHEVGEATRVPFDGRVGAGEARALFVPVPDGIPAGSLRAVLYYRNVRTTYFRFATGDPAGHAPDVLVAQTQVRDP